MMTQKLRIPDRPLKGKRTANRWYTGIEYRGCSNSGRAPCFFHHRDLHGDEVFVVGDEHEVLSCFRSGFTTVERMNWMLDDRVKFGRFDRKTNLWKFKTKAAAEKKFVELNERVNDWNWENRGNS